MAFYLQCQYLLQKLVKTETQNILTKFLSPVILYISVLLIKKFYQA